MSILTADIIMKTINENMEKMRGYGVQRIGLFGSYGKNQQRHGSDIDILVKFNAGEKTFDHYMDLKFFLEELFDCDIDLVIFDAIKSDLKAAILGSVQYAAEI